MTGAKQVAIGLVVTAGSWLASGVVARRPAPALPEVAPPAAGSDVGRARARLSANLERLSGFAQRADVYAAPARNPFDFEGAGRRPEPSADADLVEADLIEAIGEAEPPLQLSGIAEDPGPDGPIRRAVISAGGEVLLVGTGDMVLGRYRVSGIDPAGVDLVALDDGGVRRLVFR